MNLDLAPGHQVERYTVQCKLGQGGMAIVLRVRHNDLHTEHALKLLTLASPGLRQRLIQEGRVQANLRHPNIVAVTDVLTFNGAPGLLMEFVAGRSLEDWIVDYPNPQDHEVESLFRDIVSAVGHAHRQGLVHRDLKPANVMLARDGDHLAPKVTDFGLAKLVEDEMEATAGRKRTRSGVAMGTPSYMAPEQIKDAKKVDARADVFSLGCILYELACHGNQAFPGDNLLEIFQKITSGDYRPPEEVNPNIPKRWATAIRAALVVDRERRLASCEELLAVFSGKPLGRPIEAEGTFSADALDAALGDGPFKLDPSFDTLAPPEDDDVVPFSRRAFSDSALDAATSHGGPSEPVPPSQSPVTQRDAASATFGGSSSPTDPGVTKDASVTEQVSLTERGPVPVLAKTMGPMSVATGPAVAPAPVLPAPAPSRAGFLVPLLSLGVASVALAGVVGLWATGNLGNVAATAPTETDAAAVAAVDGLPATDAPVGSGVLRPGASSGTNASGLRVAAEDEFQRAIIPMAGAPVIDDPNAIRDVTQGLDDKTASDQKRVNVNVSMGTGAAKAATSDTSKTSKSGDAKKPDVVLMSSDLIAELPSDTLPVGMGAVQFGGDVLDVWLESAQDAHRPITRAGVLILAGTWRVKARFKESDAAEGVNAGSVTVKAGERIQLRCDPAFNKCVKSVTEQKAQ